MSAPAQTGTVAAVVVAAGKGLRAGQPLPKQFAKWRGKPVIRHSVEALAKAGIAPIVVVIPENGEDIAAEALAGIEGVRYVTGAETRQGSVRRGLDALKEVRPDLVLIHDAARPVLPAEVIARLCEALANHEAAIPVLPITDSLLTANGDFMGASADRDALRRVQTPQAFRFGAIVRAHEGWTGPLDAGDDAQVAQVAGIAVALVEGDEALHKLTFAHDFDAGAPALRVGTGYDVHRLAEGEELWLAGIRIEHEKGLAGHSDADVAIHAIVDAILGAVGAGDIGSHFPPSDPQWAGVASSCFLEHAASLAAEAGYAIGNLDLTIICEAPKIGPHREAMRERLAAILGVDIGVISVKATTTEKLGFTGREEGIAAQAIVSLFKS
ncbi:MAG: bifunctional 2-C-methyl-D-erythritol 4-phosphate cytidylyltransferase/2-C-methyl-D-erythritol 2,4-cyclodiphosphate synthase [Altererythrobacter sp.]